LKFEVKIIGCAKLYDYRTDIKVVYMFKLKTWSQIIHKAEIKSQRGSKTLNRKKANYWHWVQQKKKS